MKETCPSTNKYHEEDSKALNYMSVGYSDEVIIVLIKMSKFKYEH